MKTVKQVRRKRGVRAGNSRIDNKIIDGYVPPSFPGIFRAEEVKALVGTMRITVEELMLQLLPKAAERALAPISRFKVGAISRGVSGNLYFGSNIEFPNTSFGDTIHAEQSSISNAFCNGERGIRAIAVSGTPCGHCRQFMNELNTAGELKIHLPETQPIHLQNLLPSSFGPGDLDMEKRLMDETNKDLKLENPSEDRLLTGALKAANLSYAPYSGCCSGVALQVGEHWTITGAAIENAAFNPGLTAMQGALANIVNGGTRFEKIRRAVLVQQRGAKIDVEESSKRLLSAVSNVSLETFYAS